MIQVNDTEGFKGKATKGSLADFAEREAERLGRHQLWYLLAFIPIIVAEFYLKKAGWFVLPTVVVLAALYKWTDNKITSYRGRSTTYKKLKTLHPKRDSYR